MAEPYIGEIKLWGQSWAPLDWAICDGSLLQISQHAALFSLLGTTYGGDGRTNFALPDLRGRLAVGWDGTGHGSPYSLGAKFGLENVTLNSTQMPAHKHAIRVNNADGHMSFPDDNQDYFSNNGAGMTDQRYDAATNNTTPLAPETMPSPAGSGLAHPNVQPSIVGTYCISLKGLFPPRN